jgi:hypothetical protein
MKGLEACQEVDCMTRSNTCMTTQAARLKSCDVAACDAYVECYGEQDDFETAEKVCQPKLSSLDAFCRNVCEMERAIPLWYLDEIEGAESPAPEASSELSKACTIAAQCPADYGKLAPYLASFCAGTTNDASVAALEREVANKVVSKRTLSLLFNAYGAMYGYEFKRESWMNGFFYGSGGAWLPKACRDKVKTVATARQMPFYLTKLRDRVKKIWNQAP